MNLDQERNLLLAGVGSALVFSSVIAGGIQLGFRHRKSSAVANLVARIKAWWFMAAVLTTAFVAGSTPVIVLFALISFACLREFMTIAPSRHADRVAMLTAFFFFLPVQYFLVSRVWYELFLIFIPLCAFVVLPILATMRPDTMQFLSRIAATQWGLVVCVYCISYVPAMVMFPLPLHYAHILGSDDPAVPGALLAVFLLIISQFSDIMQYVFGKLFGFHELAPSISPGKTVEGLLGGLASATILGALLSGITPFGRWQAAAMALVIALMGSLGGLVMSAIKRDRGIKDWGHLVSGHGGVLDRLDSVCFAAPVFFHLTRYCLGL